MRGSQRSGFSSSRISLFRSHFTLCRILLNTMSEHNIYTKTLPLTSTVPQRYRLECVYVCMITQSCNSGHLSSDITNVLTVDRREMAGTVLFSVNYHPSIHMSLNLTMNRQQVRLTSCRESAESHDLMLSLKHRVLSSTARKSTLPQSFHQITYKIYLSINLCTCL